MNIIDVEFRSGDQDIAGNLFVPQHAPKAAITTTGPLTSVKEQVVWNYARALQEYGFAVLVFDHRHFGSSGGMPRQFESPSMKIQDIIASIDFLKTLDGTRELDVMALGICAGAGYMAQAVAQDSRVRAFGAVAGYFADKEMTRASMGARFDEAIAEARSAREVYENTGEAPSIPAVGLDNQNVAMPMRDAFEYYGTARGAVPTYVNSFAVQSREETLTFDAQSAATRIRVRTLLLHSRNALAPSLAENFQRSLVVDNELVWIDAPKQTSFYDDPAVLQIACKHLQQFFTADISDSGG